MENLLNNPVLLWVSISILTTYIITISALNGVKMSLSSSYYLFETKIKNVVFATIFIAYGGALAIYCDHWATYIAALGIAMVGINPNYKNDRVAKLHVAGAWIAGLFSYVFLVLSGLWHLVLACLIAQYLFNRYSINHKTWWIEIISFYSIYMPLAVGLC